jgi:hypothetical protein
MRLLQVLGLSEVLAEEMVPVPDYQRFGVDGELLLRFELNGHPAGMHAWLSIRREWGTAGRSRAWSSPPLWLSRRARDGRALEGVFAWLRPNDLVWHYVVNNSLLGKDPPAFDILYWNQDTVRLAAGLHRDVVRLALGDSLTHPGQVEVLGTPIDLGAITVNTYGIVGLNDHIVPWENAYRSAQLLGGHKRFVLSTSGHIPALVNPLSRESRSRYRVTETPTANPAAGCQRPTSSAEAGGPTTVIGSPREPASSRPPRGHSAAASTKRRLRPRGTTCLPSQRSDERRPHDERAGF